jgi:hypothetical protein
MVVVMILVNMRVMLVKLLALSMPAAARGRVMPAAHKASAKSHNPAAAPRYRGRSGVRARI